MATVGTSGNESPFHEYTIFAWGANSYGQLGLGHTTDTVHPTPLHFDANYKITQLCGGGGHSMMLLDNNHVISCGWNKHNQTGISSDSKHATNILSLERLPDPTSSIMKIACGWNHTLLIELSTGSLIVCGCNTHGQLGLPQIPTHTVSPERIPSRMFNSHKIVDIGCGLRHSVALTDVGTVFTWGNNRKGQLGHTDGAESHPVPMMIESLQDIKCTRVSAMAYNTAICTDDGSLFVCGCNSYGQCGLEKEDKDSKNIRINEAGLVTMVRVPIKVTPLPMVIDISCGWSHIFAITTSRHVFAWGRCDYGQLGLGPLGERSGRGITTPTKVKSLYGVKQIKCGSEHCIAIGKNDELMAWGWNEHGMCGTGNETNVLVPTEIELGHAHKPILIGAGAGHSMTVTEAV